MTIPPVGSNRLCCSPSARRASSYSAAYYGHLLLNKRRKKELNILGIERANESSFDSNALTRVATGVGFVADSPTDIAFGSLSFDMTIDHLVCTRKKDNLWRAHDVLIIIVFHLHNSDRWTVTTWWQTVEIYNLNTEGRSIIRRRITHGLLVMRFYRKKG